MRTGAPLEGNAELASTPADKLVAKPAALSFEQAAALLQLDLMGQCSPRPVAPAGAGLAPWVRGAAATHAGPGAWDVLETDARRLFTTLRWRIARALTLEGGGGRTFGAPDVRTITVRRSDSLGNGALIREFPKQYATYYAIKEYRYNNVVQQNRNRLLWMDPTVDGLKTGHTAAAGYCLAASAQRGEHGLPRKPDSMTQRKRGQCVGDIVPGRASEGDGDIGQ